MKIWERRGAQKLGSDCRGGGTMILHGGADGNWRPESTTSAVVRLTGIASHNECVFPSPASSPPLAPLLAKLNRSGGKGEGVCRVPAAAFQSCIQKVGWDGN